METTKKLKKEEPEFNVQKQYEGKFKSDFNKMLILMSKNILQYTLTDKDNVIKQPTD